MNPTSLHLTQSSPDLLPEETRSGCGWGGISSHLKCFLRNNFFASSCCPRSKKAMAPHSSTLAWKVPWTRSLVGYSPWGYKELDTTERLHSHASEKEMATHSSVLAWRIPGTGEPGGLPSMGSHSVEHD